MTVDEMDVQAASLADQIVDQGAECAVVIIGNSEGAVCRAAGCRLAAYVSVSIAESMMTPHFVFEGEEVDLSGEELVEEDPDEE